MVPFEHPEPRYRNKRMVPSPVWEEGKIYASRDNLDDVRGWKCLRCQVIVPLHNDKSSDAPKHLKNMHGIMLRVSVSSKVSDYAGSSSIASSSQLQAQVRDHRAKRN